MAHYLIGTNSTSQADSYANLKAAFANYGGTNLVVTPDDTNLKVKLQFTGTNYYFIAYVPANTLYLNVEMYSVEDSENYLYQTSMQASGGGNHYLHVLEGNDDTILFSWDGNAETYGAAIALIDGEKPVYIQAQTNNYTPPYATGDHVGTLPSANLDPFPHSDDAIQLIKIYDQQDTEFLDTLFITTIAKLPPSNVAWAVQMVSIGQKRFWLFSPTPSSGVKYRWYAVECTDKYVEA